jgi:hypothetical protein
MDPLRTSVARRLAGATAIATAVCVAALALAGASADAASFAVTNTKDSGAGSLRQAIAKAKAAAGRDKITFASRVTGAITLTSGPLTIDSTVKIDGPGAGVLTVSGNDAHRVFVVLDGVKAKILGLTISDGRIQGGDSDPVSASGGNGGRGGAAGGAGGNGGSDAEAGSPGADALGAGILNQGRLLLDRVVVSGNRGIAGSAARGFVSAEAGSGGGGGEGATGGPGGDGGSAATAGGRGGDVLGVGIANEGTMILRDTTVADNVGVGGAGGNALAIAGPGGTGGGAATATGGEGGSAAAASGRGGDALGAGVYNTGDLTIDHTTISGNTAVGGDGGNAKARGGNGGDGSTGNGGNGGSAAAAGGRGGDARGAGVFNTGALEAQDATVAGNAVLPGDAGTSSSTGGSGGSGGSGGTGGNGGGAAAAEGAGGKASGGGIENDGGSSANLLSLTISRNAAKEGSNIFAVAALEVRNTIIADPRGAGTNCSGPLTSRGHNIDSGDSCGLTRSNDQPNTNPRLGSLRNNRGPTLTQALPKRSPAVDSGTAAGLSTDQRGKPRRVNIRGRPNRFGSRGADVGAFELQKH